MTPKHVSGTINAEALIQALNDIIAAAKEAELAERVEGLRDARDTILAAIQPDPEPQPVACKCICHRQPGVTHIVACCEQPPLDPFSPSSNAVPHTATPSSAGTVSVEAEGWQPIETAPRDGTWFFACIKDAGPYKPRLVHFADAYDRYPINDVGGCWSRAPTHWTPLPEPPALRELAGERG